MTREEFVSGYMGRSGVTDYHLEGERVYSRGSVRLALPCRCEEDDCDGWAMVQEEGREWHLWQNGIKGAKASGQEAMNADMVVLKRIIADSDSDTRPKDGDAKQGSTRE